MFQVKSKSELLFLLLSLAPSVTSTIWFCVAVPKFQPLFNGFGSEIPLVTRVLTNFYPLTLIAPIVVFFTWKYWPFQKYRSFVSMVVGVLVGLITICFYVWVLYLPVFKLGKP